MTLASGAAIYFIMWWLVLFTVLPWGTRNAHEAGVDIEEGHASGAPVQPRLLRKFAITTVVSAILFGAFYAVVTSGLISLDDIPILPNFEPYQ